MLDKLLSSCVPYDDNQQDFELKFNSIHDTDVIMSEDSADKKYHLLELDHKTYYKIQL